MYSGRVLWKFPCRSAASVGQGRAPSELEHSHRIARPRLVGPAWIADQLLEAEANWDVPIPANWESSPYLGLSMPPDSKCSLEERLLHFVHVHSVRVNPTGSGSTLDQKYCEPCLETFDKVPGTRLAIVRRASLFVPDALCSVRSQSAGRPSSSKARGSFGGPRSLGQWAPHMPSVACARSPQGAQAHRKLGAPFGGPRSFGQMPSVACARRLAVRKAPKRIESSGLVRYETRQFIFVSHSEYTGMSLL